MFRLLAWTPSATTQRTGVRALPLAAIGTVVGLLVLVPLLALGRPRLADFALVAAQLQTLSTVFLGIFIEALPFLLLGVIASALIDVFVSDAMLARVVPRRALPAASVGALLGLLLPVCECGVIPVSRRLLNKGAPLPLAVAFMLAGPVVNPVVIASTWTAFGDQPELAIGRFAVVIVTAMAVALVFGLNRNPAALLTPRAQAAGDHRHGDHQHQHGCDDAPVVGARGKAGAVLRHATDEFAEMSRYFVTGALIAASLQTFVPRGWLATVGQEPVLSVLVLMGLAVVLSICSTVDAFVALSFGGIFSSGAILAFLAYGPMVDVKSTLMYTAVLRRPAVALLVLVSAQLVFLVAVAMNLSRG